MMIVAEGGVPVPQKQSGKDVRRRMFKRTSRKMARDSVRVEEQVGINGPRSSKGSSYLAFTLVPSYNARESHPRVTRHPSLSGAVAPARTKRISPGLARGLAAALGRTRSLSSSPFLRSSQLLPLPSTTLPFSFLSVSAFLSHSSAYGARSETPLPSFSRVSPTRCCVRAVKYA